VLTCSSGAEVNVVRGDVSIRSDVELAVSNVPYPIGGVILAAMGLEVSLFPLICRAQIDLRLGNPVGFDDNSCMV
jgi:hypothetical protein